jgi:secreted PhoX family phosphatase
MTGHCHVARFAESGGGRWLPLRHGLPGLTAANGFADQADVLIRTRQAADVVQVRRAWTVRSGSPCHPRTGEVYCALTNNAKRGSSEVPGLNAANRRPENLFGHIRALARALVAMRRRRALSWEVFIECGDPSLS